MDCSVVVSILAMALHPDKRQKAQEEIDRIVGAERLPTLEDRPSLPYVEAFLREGLRWRPVVPINPAHSSIKDDTYEGYYIPKGGSHFFLECQLSENFRLPHYNQYMVILCLNTCAAFYNVLFRAISRDEEMYQDPESFIPERFFKTDGTLNADTVSYAFGFGRRYVYVNLLMFFQYQEIPLGFVRVDSLQNLRLDIYILKA